MRIVGGLDVHRRQITFDYVDERSGQTRRGRIAPADRMLLRRWLAVLPGEVGQAGDGWAVADRGVGPVMVVLVQPGRQGLSAG